MQQKSIEMALNMVVKTHFYIIGCASEQLFMTASFDIMSSMTSNSLSNSAFNESILQKQIS